MPTEFRLGRHTTMPVVVCEVWVDGRMLATLYPGLRGFRMITRHAFAVSQMDDAGIVEIELRPR